jgi:hypothetical protein
MQKVEGSSPFSRSQESPGNEVSRKARRLVIHCGRLTGDAATTCADGEGGRETSRVYARFSPSLCVLAATLRSRTISSLALL